jgi:hypothetical protein
MTAANDQGKSFHFVAARAIVFDIESSFFQRLLPCPACQASWQYVMRCLDQKEASFYKNVLQLLNRHRIPYAIAGAFALHQHTGIWRVTKDLDVFLTAESLSRALSVLSKKGFKCEITDAVWLAKVRKGRFFIDLITGMSNAVFVVDDTWISRARPALVLGVKTRILGTEELLVSKLFVSRRERFDGADIAHCVWKP